MPQIFRGFCYVTWGTEKDILCYPIYVVCYIFCFITDVTKRSSGKSVYFLCNICTRIRFQASSHFLWLMPLFSQVCVIPGWKPKDRSSHDMAQVLRINFDRLSL